MDYSQTPTNQMADPNFQPNRQFTLENPAPEGSNFELDQFNLNTNEWNLSNPESSMSQQPERTERLGSSAIAGAIHEQPPVLGQITPTFPPGYDPAPSPTPETVQEAVQETANLATIRQKLQADRGLNSADVKIIDSVVADLNRSGDIDNFYEQIRADATASPDATASTEVNTKAGKQ